MVKLNKIGMIAVLLAIVHSSGLGLDPKRSLKQYIHESWNSDNGLPQNSVTSMLQSRDGYMWFATQEGVVRYDGFKFTIFDRNSNPELPGNNVGGLLEDRSGNIWVFFAGLPLARYTDGKFKVFTGADGLIPTPRNNGGMDSSGAIWLTTNNGVNKIENDRVTTLTRKDGLPTDTVFAMYADREGGIWFILPLKLARLKDGKFTVYSKADGLLSDSINTIREDPDGSFWIGTQSGLNKLSNGSVTSYTAKDGLSGSSINSLYFDPRNQLWVGTNKGLFKFENGKFLPIPYADGSEQEQIFIAFRQDPQGSIWLRPASGGIGRVRDGVIETFKKSDGLTDNNIQSGMVDQEGSYWIGTNGAGLNRLRDTKFVTYGTEDGLSENVIQTIFEDKDQNWWIGTNNSGLNEYTHGKFITYTTKNGLASNALQSVCQDKNGTVWAGTNSGLSRFDGKKFTTYTTKNGLVADQIHALLVDHTGTLYAAGALGISMYRDGKFSTVYRDDNAFMFSLFEDRNNVIWSTGFGGMINIKDGKASPVPLPDELKNTPGFGIYQDIDGTMWFGTAGNGIVRLKDGKYTAITPKNGLFDYNAYCFLEDEFGNMWTDCNKGIYKVSKKDLNDFCDGKIKSVTCTAYGTADGMKNRECNGGSSPCAWKMHDGRLAFSTVKGVATIYPADIKLNMVPPPVVIEAMASDQGQVNPKMKNIFSAGTEKFEFHFAGISFIGGDKVQYKYMLEPFEKEWVDAGSRRDAFYTHIPPGEYVFRVKAANSDGVWNELGATTSFTLKPFFYQSAWFLAICVVGFVGVGPGIYMMRVRQLKRREIELTGLVDARTRDLKKEKENVESALTNLKDAQHQLVLSEKMASLGQLTAGIAHEIKNPLNFVNNFAALSHDLMEDLKDELNKKKENFDAPTQENIDELLSSLQQNVTKINEHGKRADSIVRGMLLHSRGKTGERQMTDLNALLAEYTSLAYHGMRAQDSSFNVKIETNFDETIGRVNVVPQDLSRVFLNIINNGCYSANDKKKHAPEGFAPTIRVSSKDRGDKFEVRIWDNGNGVPKSVLDKIFNPFFTTKPAGAGTGLGLSMSYDIITQEHKGEVHVNTKEGEFAEFIITIPKN